MAGPFELELEIAKEVAKQAGAHILSLRDAGIAVDTKHDASPVTQADREADALIVARLRKAFRHIETLSRSQLDGGEPLSASGEWRQKMAALEIEIDAVEMNELMFYSSLKTGDAPGQMASVVKMRGTEVGQKVSELAVEAVRWYGVPFTELRNYDSNIVPIGGDYVDDVAPRYFNNRKTTIYGVSSEVQRNVLAKAMLGL